MALLGFEDLKDPRVGGNGSGVNNAGTLILPDPQKKFFWEMLLRQGTCIRLDSITPPAGMLPVLPALQNNIELTQGDWLLIFSSISRVFSACNSRPNFARRSRNSPRNRSASARLSKPTTR